MEPRPPKSTRPVPAAPSPVFTPPPVPTSERLAARPAWLDESPPVVTGQGRDDRGALDLESAPTIPPSQARAAWYDPTGEPAPGMDQDATRSPLSPVVSPRGERRSRFLGPLLAALLLVLVVGGAAFAVDKARDGNDQRDSTNATRVAQLAALDSTPVATATTEADVVVSPTTEIADAAAAPLATATPKPTQEQATKTADEATPTKRAPTKEPTPRPSSLRAPDFLPDLNEVPDGFVVSGDGKLSKDDVIASIGENGAELLAEWEWRENAYRYFEIPQDADPDPESASSLTVSVHRFRSRDGATAALTGLAEIVASTGYDEVKIDKIGDQTEALKTETAEGNVFVLYVRTANFVIRLGGFSVSGDSSDAVIELAKTIVEG